MKDKDGSKGISNTNSKITLKTNIWIDYSYKVASWIFEANAKNLIDLVNYLNPNVAFSYLVV